MSNPARLAVGDDDPIEHRPPALTTIEPTSTRRDATPRSSDGPLLISNGRFVCGVGFGWERQELAHHGISWDERQEVVWEHVATIRTLWAAATRHLTPMPDHRPHRSPRDKVPGVDIDEGDLAALRSVTQNLAASIASVTSEQRGWATPCAAWDLAALVDHITGGNWFTTAILDGEDAHHAIDATMARFGDGSAARDVGVRSLEYQVNAFLQPEVLHRTWSHVAGNLTGRQILRLRMHDLVVHSWDVQETLQPGMGLPDDLLAWALDEIVHADSLTAQHFGLDKVSLLRSDGGRKTTYLEAFGR